METANEDPSVESFTIKGDKGSTCAKFERKNFKKYIYDEFDTEDDIHNEKVIDEETIKSDMLQWHIAFYYIREVTTYYPKLSYMILSGSTPRESK